MEKMKIREWESQHWVDPTEFLRQLRELEYSIALSDLGPRVKSLRTHKLRDTLERRQAALFGVGLKTYLENESVQFCHFENSDYDVVYRRIHDDAVQYTPVQLKEIVPEHLNANSTLDEGLERLKKYTTSEDLNFAIHFNQQGAFDIREVTIPESLNFAGLFLYGGCSMNQKEWFVSGNLMREERVLYKFEHPEPQEDSGSNLAPG